MYAANLQKLKLVRPKYYNEVGCRNHFSRQQGRRKEGEEQHRGGKKKVRRENERRLYSGV